VLWVRLLPSPALRQAAGSSETVVAIYQTARLHISEDTSLLYQLLYEHQISLKIKHVWMEKWDVAFHIITVLLEKRCVVPVW